MSITYGISKNESHKLRLGKYGMLKFSKVGQQHYLPLDKDAECFKSSDKFCFGAGDLRATLQPGVLVGQTIAMRLHNYCAKKLHKVNPHWDDDRLFYEARQITIAIFQHITYTEYLPLLIGWQFMYDYGILPPTSGYSYDYDPEVKPWTFHEFAGAAFRHHSAVYGKVVLADEHYKTENALPLEKYYNSGMILKNPYNYDKIIRGYIQVPQRKVDEYYDPSVSIGIYVAHLTLIFPLFLFYLYSIISIQHHENHHQKNLSRQENFDLFPSTFPVEGKIRRV